MRERADDRDAGCGEEGAVVGEDVHGGGEGPDGVAGDEAEGFGAKGGGAAEGELEEAGEVGGGVCGSGA